MLESEIRGSASATGFGPPATANHSPDTVKLRGWLRSAQESAAIVGELPPSPGTLRARVGLLLVRLVRRLLFWFTPQINGFNAAALGVMREQTELIETLNARVAELDAQLRMLQSQTDALQARPQPDLDGFGKRLEQLRETQTSAESSAAARILQLRSMVFAQDRRLGMLLADVRKRMPEALSPQESARLGTELDHELDPLYLAFEDELRGSREEIARRLAEYLPTIEGASAGGPDRPILDLGSGRGEWLELLKDRKLHASGVDLNRTFVSLCHQLGLAVTQGDAIAHLRTFPDRSLGAVTGFHIVEHLPWTVLVAMIDETVRVLKPGGAAIFETPNPTNVLVGSNHFYFDPTHRNPLPPLLLRFLLEARGLCGVEILPLHPADAHRLPADGTAVTERFNQLFYGPQDYAVIGRKV